MNVRFGLTEKLLPLAAMLTIAVAIGACSKPNEASTPKGSLIASDSPRPPKIAKAFFYGGGMCSVDSTTPGARSNQIAASIKSQLVVNGWVAEETTLQRALPWAYVILNGEHGTYYIEGKRVPRPDVAAALGKRMFDHAGFDAVGDLSHIPIGEYRLSLAAGDNTLVAVCPTGLTVRVGG